MKIRKAKKEDARKICFLRNKTFEKINGKDYSKKHVIALNKKNTIKSVLEKMKERDMFCAINNQGKILGTIDLEGNKVGGFYVRYNYIGEGIGKRLLQFVESYAKKKKIKKLKLYSTITAYNFYLNQGYKLVGESVWKIDKVVFPSRIMEKKI